MNKYKITYWNNGNICVAETEAESIVQARYWFFMSVPCDDIISIEQIEGDNE